MTAPLPRAFVDSDRRCAHCSKRMAWETHYDAENRPFAVEECLSCGPGSTGEASYLEEYGLAGGVYELCSEDDPAVIAGRALRKRRAS